MPNVVGAHLPWSNGFAVSEPDREEPVAKQHTVYVCPRGHEFDRPFALDAEPPGEWECPHHGTASTRLTLATILPAAQRNQSGKTPWDHLMERRTISGLEQLLDERLAQLAAERNETTVAAARTAPEPNA